VPKCGKRKLRRVYGAGAAILFKGSGFYQTDYRSEAYKTAAKADQPRRQRRTNGTAAKDRRRPRHDAVNNQQNYGEKSQVRDVSFR